MPKQKRTNKRITRRPAKKIRKQQIPTPGQLSFLQEIVAVFQAPVK